MNTLLRIVKLNIVDIVFDPRHAGDVVAKACTARSGAPMRPTDAAIPAAESFAFRLPELRMKKR